VTDKDDAHLALAWGFMPNLIRQIKIGEALSSYFSFIGKYFGELLGERNTVSVTALMVH